jgi:hypothetical protein
MGTDEEQPSESQPAQERATVDSTGKRMLLWILLALTLVLAVGLTLGLVLRNKGNSQDSSASDQGNVPSIDNPANNTTSANLAPWPHEESDIPKELNLRVGKLENGLRYMILSHPWPEGQVSFRLHIDAGSLMEDDDQLGYVVVIEVCRLLLEAGSDSLILTTDGMSSLFVCQF